MLTSSLAHKPLNLTPLPFINFNVSNFQLTNRVSRRLVKSTTIVDTIYVETVPQRFFEPKWKYRWSRSRLGKTVVLFCITRCANIEVTIHLCRRCDGIKYLLIAYLTKLSNLSLYIERDIDRRGRLERDVTVFCLAI